MITSSKRDPLQRSVGEAQTSFRRIARFRPGAKRVADMNDGHVDEIEQRSVRASFSQSAGFSQFLGDLDQAIGFRHGVVRSLGCPDISCGGAAFVIVRLGLRSACAFVIP